MENSPKLRRRFIVRSFKTFCFSQVHFLHVDFTSSPPPLSQYLLQLLQQLCIFLLCSHCHSQTRLASDLISPEPDYNSLTFRQTLVHTLGLDVIRSPIVANDLHENKVGVASANNTANAWNRKVPELANKLAAPGRDRREAGLHCREAGGAKGLESESGGRGRDVVRSFGIVEELDERGIGDGNAKSWIGGGKRGGFSLQSWQQSPWANTRHSISTPCRTQQVPT